MVLDKLGNSLKTGIRKISNAITIDRKLVDEKQLQHIFVNVENERPETKV